MRKFIQKIGHTKLIVLITILSIIASELLTYLLCKVFDLPYLVPETPFVAFIIPLTLVPIGSWQFFKFLFKIDELEREMRYLANHDSMTKLLSRQAFFKRSLALHKNAISEKKSYVVVIIDLDNFKHINDSYGHSVGDRVLENLGKLFQESFVDSEIIGRIGGEEFALIMYSNSKNQEKIVDDFREKVSKVKLFIDAHTINYTISIGLFNNLLPNDVNFDKALSNADYALYHAKVTGKNKTVIFTPSLISEDINQKSSFLRRNRGESH